MSKTNRYIPNPLAPQDEEGKAKYLSDELNKISSYTHNVADSIGDEGGTTPPDPTDPDPPTEPPEVPGHYHDHRNILNRGALDSHPISAITGLEARLSNFPYKDADTPVFLFGTGQSQITGGPNAITEPFTPNAKVFDWSAGGTGQGSPHSWLNQDLTAAEYADYTAAPNDTYTGMTRGRGNMLYAAADMIQKRTGRDVYILNVGRNGTAIAEWLPGGDLETVIVQRIAEVLATPELAGITFTDGIIWAQGESDGLRTIDDYVADWYTVRDWMEASFARKDTTMWAVTDTPSLEGSFYRNARYFYANLDSQNDEFLRVVRADNYTSYDNLHFTGDDAMTMGTKVSRVFLEGPSPKMLNSDFDGPLTYELDDLTDVELINRKVGQGLFIGDDGVTWQNRASFTESWPTGLANGGELNIAPTDPNFVLEGNGTRYIQIPSFTIPAGQFRIAFDIIWTGGGNQFLIAGDGVAGQAQIYAPANGNLEFGINSGSTITWNGFFSGLVEGQQASVVITGDSSVPSVFTAALNGVSVGQDLGSGTLGDLTFTSIMSRGGVLTAASSLQNVTLENLTTGEYIQYKIDEGSGTAIKAYDSNGDEFSGSEVITGWGSPTDPAIIVNGLELVYQNVAGNVDALTPLEVGSSYLFEYEIYDWIGGSFSLNAGGAAGTARSGNGVYSEVLTATGTECRAASRFGNFNGKIRNATAKETKEGTVTPDASWVDINAGADGIEVIAGVGAVIDSYTDPDSPPIVQSLSWDQINEPITASPPVAGEIAWFSIYDTGVAGFPVGGVPTNIGALKQYSVGPDPTLAREEIFLGIAIHNGVEWKEVSSPKVINQTAETLREVVTTVLPPSRIISGGQITEQAGFTLNQAEGVIWENNRNWHVSKSDPNREALPAATPIVFEGVNRDFSVVQSPTSIINADQWDNNGVIEPIPGPANTATIHRLYIDLANNYWLLIGQKLYANWNEAQANRQAYQPEVPFLLQNSLYLGAAIVEKGKADWDIDEATFQPPVESGGGPAAGTPITTYTGLVDTPASYTGDIRKVATVADDELSLVHDYRNQYNNNYIVGPTYYPQEWVANFNYIAICNTETTDEAFPQNVGLPEKTYPAVPPFLEAADNSVVRSGHYFTFSTPGNVEQILIWIPEVTVDTSYSLVTINDPKGAAPLITRISLESESLTANAWNLVTAGSSLATTGAEFLIYLEAQNFGATTQVTGGWRYDGQNNTAAPLTSGWNHNNAQSILRIDKTDLDVVGRATELLGIAAGSTIQFVDTVTPTNQNTYFTLAAPVDQGTYIEYSVSLQSQSGNIAVSDATTMTADIPVAQPTKFSYQTDKWLTEEPTWASISSFLQYDGVDQAVGDDVGYGIDIQFQQLSQSPDWNLIPVGGGGGGGGDFTPDLFTGAGTTGYVPDPVTEQGYVLSDNGSWVEQSGGGSFWEANGDDIYNTNVGNVGVGTTTPSNELEVLGTTDTSTLLAGNTQLTGGHLQAKAGTSPTGNILEGDGTRYIEIPQFVAADGEDFRVSLDWIRQDSTGALTRALSDGSASVNYIGLGNTTYVAGGTIAVASSTVSGSNNIALSDVAIGQHCNVVVERVSGVVSYTVDGTLMVDTSPMSGDVIYTRIGHASGGFALGTGSALQNVTLENLTTGEYVQYRVDEGIGTVVKSYDKQGNEIALGAELIGDWSVSATPAVVYEQDGSIILDGAANTNSIQNRGGEPVANDKYEVTYEVYDYIEGATAARLGGVFGTNRTANGVYTEIITPTGIAFPLLYARATPSTLKVRNVSIRRIETGTITPDASWANTGGELRLSGNPITMIGGSVGIGTDAPAGLLDVTGTKGSTKFVDGNEIQFTRDSATYISNEQPNGLMYYRANSHSFVNDTFGTTFMTINSAGNVGIGVLAPTSSTPTGGLDAAGYVIARGAISGHQTSAMVMNHSDASRTSAIRAYSQDTISQPITFSNGPAGGPDVERMRINSDGKVGIGTTGPAVNLDVRNNDNALLQLQREDGSNGAKLQIGAYNSAQVIISAFQATDTPSQIIFRQGATADAEAMRLNASGNFGIGTSSPQTRLSVDGAISVTNEAGVGMWLQGSTAMRTTGQPSSATHYFDLGKSVFRNSNGSTSGGSMEVYGTGYFSGNVGIGTSSPSAKLQVQEGDLFLRAAGYSDTTRIGFGNAARAGDAAYIDYIGAGNFTGSLAFGVVTTASNVPASEVMRISSAGYVGIGTTTPTSLLTVSDSSTLEAGEALDMITLTKANVNAASSGAAINFLPAFSSAARIVGRREGAAVATVLGFETSDLNDGTSTEKMRITSAGNVGIGTPTPTDGKLVVLETGFVPLVLKSLSSASRIRFDDSGSTNQVFLGSAGNTMQFLTSAAERMRIDSTGNVGIGLTSPLYKLHVGGTLGVSGDMAIDGKITGPNQAWGHISATGAILGNWSVSSVQKVSTGNYNVNFGGAAASTNAQSAVASVVSIFGFTAMCTPQSTTQIRVSITNTANAYADVAFMIQRTY